MKAIIICIFLNIYLLQVIKAQELSPSEQNCKQLRDDLGKEVGPVDPNLPLDTSLTLRPLQAVMAIVNSSVGLTSAGNRAGLYVVSINFEDREIFDWNQVKLDRDKYTANCSLDDAGILRQTLMIKNAQYHLAGTYATYADGYKHYENATTEVVILGNVLSCTTSRDLSEPILAGKVCSNPDFSCNLTIVCSLNYAGNVAPRISFNLDNDQNGSVHVTNDTRSQAHVSTVVYTLRMAISPTMNNSRFTASVSVDGANIVDNQNSQLTWTSAPIKIAYFSCPVSTREWVTRGELSEGVKCHVDTNLPVEVKWFDSSDGMSSSNSVLLISSDRVPIGSEYYCKVIYKSNGCADFSQEMMAITIIEDSKEGWIMAVKIVFPIILMVGLFFICHQWLKIQGRCRVGGAVTGIAQLGGKTYVICQQSKIIRVFHTDNLKYLYELELTFTDGIIPIGDLAACQKYKCLYLYGLEKSGESKHIWRLTEQPKSFRYSGVQQENNDNVKDVYDGHHLSGKQCRMTILPGPSNSNFLHGNVFHRDLNKTFEAYLFRSSTKFWLAVKLLDPKREKDEDTLSVNNDGNVLVSRDLKIISPLEFIPPRVDVIDFKGDVESIKLSNEFTEMQHIIQSNTDGNFIVSHGYQDKTLLNRVCKVKADGTEIIREFGLTIGNEIDKLSSPDHVAVDVNGYVYVADSKNCRVLQLCEISTVGEDEKLINTWNSRVLVQKAEDRTSSRLSLIDLGNGWSCLMIGWWSSKIQRIYLRNSTSTDFNIFRRLKYFWKNGKYWPNACRCLDLTCHA